MQASLSRRSQSGPRSPATPPRSADSPISCLDPTSTPRCSSGIPVRTPKNISIAAPPTTGSPPAPSRSPAHARTCSPPLSPNAPCRRPFTRSRPGNTDSGQCSSPRAATTATRCRRTCGRCRNRRSTAFRSAALLPLDSCHTARMGRSGSSAGPCNDCGRRRRLAVGRNRRRRLDRPVRGHLRPAGAPGRRAHRGARGRRAHRTTHPRAR